MKKVFYLIFLGIVLALCACTTNVGVDSPTSPIGTYDGLSGEFYAKLHGNINNAFKATNLALENDLKFFRVGQISGDNSWLVYARAELDIKILVSLKQLPNNEVEVCISYGDGDMLKSQQIFNAIAKNMRSYN